MGISGSPVVRATPNRINRHEGFDRGYDFFADDRWQEPGVVPGGWMGRHENYDDPVGRAREVEMRLRAASRSGTASTEVPVYRL